MLLFLRVLVLTTAAAAAAGEDLTVSEAIAQAFEHNPSLAAVGAEQRAREAEARAAAAAWLPTFVVTGQATATNEGAGIIVRNGIILVDFIELKLREGLPLAVAIEEAGVVRFRPMLLTASAVLVGSAIMLTDPIFQGLAISLMAGEVAATLLSRIAVPVLYFVVARRGRAAELQAPVPPPDHAGEDAQMNAVH